jgi:hypothetical protein
LVGFGSLLEHHAFVYDWLDRQDVQQPWERVETHAFISIIIAEDKRDHVENFQLAYACAADRVLCRDDVNLQIS